MNGPSENIVVPGLQDDISPAPEPSSLASDSENRTQNWVTHTNRRFSRTHGGPLELSDLKELVRRGCSVRSWRRRLPISLWIPKYSLQDLKGDVIAGITVGLTVIPQALAYSQIADLPLEYGLYSAFMGCFMYTLFGTSKDVTLGPTAIISLLTAEAFPKDAGLFKPQYAVLLCFFTGILQLAMGVLNLGFLISFVSTPVISGFTTASAFIILYGQIKSILGVSFGKSTDTLVAQTRGYFMNLWRINGWDVLMGVLCIAILLAMKECKLPKKRKDIPEPSYQKYLREVVRLFSVARYGIVVILATTVGFTLEYCMHGRHPLTLTKEVRAGLPAFQVPEFAFNNKTFPGVFEELGPGLIVVTLVGAMESIAIAKAFAHQFSYNISPTQEFFALGMANLMSSFVSSYPVTGSFTKSALNAQSGVRTPMGCVFTGLFVIISVSLCSASFCYVPKAALGAVIICAVSVMFEFKIFKDLWVLNKKELLPLSSTIAVGLFFGVDFGLLAGISLSLILLLYPLARPAVDVETEEITLSRDSREKRQIIISVTPQGVLYFPSVEYIKEFFEEDIIPRNSFGEVAEASPSDSEDNGDSSQAAKPVLVHKGITMREVDSVIVFNGIHLIESDYTTLRGLRSVVMSCKKHRKTLRFINTPVQILKTVLPKDVREQVLLDKTADGAHNAVTVQFSKSLSEKLASLSVDVAGSEGNSTHEPDSDESFPSAISEKVHYAKNIND